MKLAMIAVGYNRPKSLNRLLLSLLEVDYGGDCVDLIISLDKGPCENDLLKIANQINWNYGNKKIRTFSKRQGLRAHIIQCGDLTEHYDGAVILEDDLIVSKGVYAYCKQMILYYGNDDRIAGISLYKHRINPGNLRPFDPAENSKDVYFMQVAQSWGQCWTKGMWKGFKKWYLTNRDSIKADASFPDYIANWNDSSWLKYYNKYIVEENKFFVYPYKSLSTNHTDIGEHNKIVNNDFQVPLLTESMNYRCVPLEEGIKYDIFFERIGISEYMLNDLDGKKTLDLMGMKTKFEDSDYLISVQALPYKVVKQLQLCYRPVEENLHKPVPGTGIYVYDLHTPAKLPKKTDQILDSYDIRGILWRRALRHGINGFLSTVRNFVKKI